MFKCLDFRFNPKQWDPTSGVIVLEYIDELVFTTHHMSDVIITIMRCMKLEGVCQLGESLATLRCLRNGIWLCVHLLENDRLQDEISFALVQCSKVCA
jgi:hypothetical protein